MVKQTADPQLLEGIVAIGGRLMGKAPSQTTTRIEFNFPHHIASARKPQSVGNVMMHFVFTYFPGRRRTQVHIGYTIVDSKAPSYVQGVYTEVVTTEHCIAGKAYEKVAPFVSKLGISRDNLMDGAASAELYTLERFTARDYLPTIDALVGEVTLLNGLETPTVAQASDYFLSPDSPQTETVIVIEKDMGATRIRMLGANTHGIRPYADAVQKDKTLRNVVVAQDIPGTAEHHIRALLAGRLEGSFIPPDSLYYAVDSLSVVNRFSYIPAVLFGKPNDRYSLLR